MNVYKLSDTYPNLFGTYIQRIRCIDYILSFLSDTTTTKFYILASIHYSLFALLYSIILLSKSFLLVYVSYIVLCIQIILNYYDNGCFLMKLERKYIGKDWIGPYSLLDFIFGKGYMNTNKSTGIFFIVSNFVLVFGIIKLFYLCVYGS